MMSTTVRILLAIQLITLVCATSKTRRFERKSFGPNNDRSFTTVDRHISSSAYPDELPEYDRLAFEEIDRNPFDSPRFQNRFGPVTFRDGPDTEFPVFPSFPGFSRIPVGRARDPPRFPSIPGLQTSRNDARRNFRETPMDEESPRNPRNPGPSSFQGFQYTPDMQTFPSIPGFSRIPVQPRSGSRLPPNFLKDMINNPIERSPTNRPGSKKSDEPTSAENQMYIMPASGFGNLGSNKQFGGQQKDQATTKPYEPANAENQMYIMPASGFGNMGGNKQYRSPRNNQPSNIPDEPRFDMSQPFDLTAMGFGNMGGNGGPRTNQAATKPNYPNNENQMYIMPASGFGNMGGNKQYRGPRNNQASMKPVEPTSAENQMYTMPASGFGNMGRNKQNRGPRNNQASMTQNDPNAENQMYMMPASGFGNMGGSKQFGGPRNYQASNDSGAPTSSDYQMFMPILGQKIIEVHKDFGDPQCEEISRLALDMHNEYRAKHGCPKLKYSKDIAKVAQAYAETLSRSSVFQHSKQDTYGENLFMREGGEDRTAEEIVREGIQAWYDEEKDYQLAYGNTHPTPAKGKVGHFTALVWKDTREVGIGVTKRGSKYILVANYFPPGNFLGLFAENVPRPLK